ncbi:rhodanese-like domain-containing protein [Poriferisphaera sp. WC338]|uniref:rhodanese-like domain-containing protein n=1 Tax=Poriferisphaera sp. WC338 TaxID=3425129 RepID=UPI003D81A14B
MSTFSTINAKDSFAALSAGKDIILIDVRMPGEYEGIHAQGAILEPLDKLNAAQIKKAYTGKTIHVICQSGARAKKACDKLVADGMENIVLVEGGTDAWVEANLPVVKGERKVISLMRQVQIAAGSLIVLGILLWAFVNPWGLVLSGFVGCGLIFAGLTDTCGMAIILAKMPWNKGSSCGKSCSTSP